MAAVQTLPAIRYRRRVGCAPDSKRPEERSVLFKAMCGHPIDVENEADYISLCHVFERMPESARYRMSGDGVVRPVRDGV